MDTPTDHQTAIIDSGHGTVAQLIVRKVDDQLVHALKQRAAKHGRSAEAEHREILRQALEEDAEAEHFKDFLLEMPDVGEDKDFERIRDLPRHVEL